MTEQEIQTRDQEFTNNMNLMYGIVAEMREIPQLPSEAPKDVSALTKVEFLEEGGVLTWMEGHEYPYKGFPFYEFVDRIDYMKKLTRSFLSGLYHSFKPIRKVWILTLIPSIWVSKILLRAIIYTFYRMIERFRIKSHRYCKSVRELYRAFTYEDPSEKSQDTQLRLQLRDLMCMILEFDNAYRYRFQDIMEDLDILVIKEKPLNEIIRLFDIMSSREKTQEIKDTWTLIKSFVYYYVKYDKSLLKILANTLYRINTEKAILDEGDRHYCEKRTDYNFKHYDVSKRILSQ